MRLVEQEEVGIGDQQAGQRRTGLFPARQARRAAQVAGLEAQARQRGLHTPVQAVAVAGFEAVPRVGVGRRGHPLPPRLLPGAPARAHRPPGRQPPHGPRPAGGRTGERGIQVRFLAEEADREARLAHDAPAVGAVRAGGKAEQCRLARAVDADQADALAVGHGGRHVVAHGERISASASTAPARRHCSALPPARTAPTAGASCARRASRSASSARKRTWMPRSPARRPAGRGPCGGCRPGGR